MIVPIHAAQSVTLDRYWSIVLSAEICHFGVWQKLAEIKWGWGRYTIYISLYIIFILGIVLKGKKFAVIMHIDLVTEIETSFTIQDTTLSGSIQEEEDLQGPEDITLEELDEAFAVVEEDNNALVDPALTGDKAEIHVEQVFSLEELDHIEKGMTPTPFEDEIRPVDSTSDAADWDVQSLLQSSSITT